MINRRTVLKAIGAALFAPQITLRQEVDIERLLMTFCDSDSFRWDLDKPFGIGSLTYATDRRHMVRAEIPSRIEIGERRIPRNVEEVWRGFWRPVAFTLFELPPIESLTIAPRYGGTCPLCDDRCVSLGEAYPDDATIRDLEKFGYDVDTNTCRDRSCPLCRGREYYGPSVLEVHGVRMSYSRLKPVASLPNVRVAASQTDDVLLFQADGIEGMTMGLTRD